VGAFPPWGTYHFNPLFNACPHQENPFPWSRKSQGWLLKPPRWRRDWGKTSERSRLGHKDWNINCRSWFQHLRIGKQDSALALSRRCWRRLRSTGHVLCFRLGMIRRLRCVLLKRRVRMSVWMKRVGREGCIVTVYQCGRCVRIIPTVPIRNVYWCTTGWLARKNLRSIGV